MQLDKKFHDLLDRIVDNNILKETNERCYLRSCRLWLRFKDELAPIDRVCKEFVLIYEALKKKDSILAEKACREHLLHSIEVIKEKFSQLEKI